MLPLRPVPLSVRARVHCLPQRPFWQSIPALHLPHQHQHQPQSQPQQQQQRRWKPASSKKALPMARRIPQTPPSVTPKTSQQQQQTGHLGDQGEHESQPAAAVDTAELPQHVLTSPTYLRDPHEYMTVYAAIKAAAAPSFWTPHIKPHDVATMCCVVKCGISRGTPPDQIVESLKNATFYVSEESLFATGRLFSHKTDPSAEIRIGLWATSASLGHPDARILLSRLIYSLEHEPSPRTHILEKISTDEAVQSGDWVAMTLQAEKFKAQGKSDDACKMAKRAYETMRYPGQEDVDPPEHGQALPPAPWETLAKVCRPCDSREKQEAWYAGAITWDDPHACALHALSADVRAGSEQWLIYATKAAMAGHVKSMQDLGKYYLAVHGWYPYKKGLPWQIGRSELGFHWLELSLVLESPFNEACMWAGLAMVWRECGWRGRGRQVLQRGRKQIEEKCKCSEVSAAEEANALRQIDDLVNAWDAAVLAKKADSWKDEYPLTVSHFLGDPIVPVSSQDRTG